jgi:glycosyltransferase involved in cell wall biosynthesis
MKTIAILTQFQSYSEAYSLNRVVMNQIRMLVDNGYKPIVIVGQYFEPVFDYADPNVIIKRIPDVPVSNTVECDSTFDQDVMALEKALSSALEGVDVVLTHDIIYQPACIKHLVASKRIAKRRPDLRWLHWIHSATSPYTLQNLRPLFVDEYANIIGEKFPNSFYIFFNHYSIPRIANNFKVDDEDVKIVHHPTDIKAFWKIDDSSWSLIRKRHILDADVICTYPIRLDRGKQVEKVIKTIASFKKLGKSVCLIIGDFHSTGDDKVVYREECKKVGKEWGLNENELIWLSEQRSDWEVEVPYTVIADFMHLSNVFVGASVSESYSLITQEAGLSGVGMILNRDFPPFRDAFGWAPHQIPFSSNIDALTGLDGNTTTNINDEGQFYLDAARVLNYELEHSRTLSLKTALRKYRNLDYVFKHELESLFYFEPVPVLEGEIVK